MLGGGFLLAPITLSPEALVSGGTFLVLCSDSAMDQSSIPRSWEGLLSRGLFLVVEEDAICFPLLLGVSAILLPLEFADLVDTGRVLAEAAPFVVVRFVVGSDVFWLCAMCFWGVPHHHHACHHAQGCAWIL